MKQRNVYKNIRFNIHVPGIMLSTVIYDISLNPAKMSEVKILIFQRRN